ncbi:MULTISPECIES: aminoacyl-tRNA hydrolase [Anaerolinea]|uniref:aminoacyl-tRNA hydrolase n=1 Tax=Anaerolinea TaxID=233189 RepID=UPI002639BFB2|nr:aminoacyl-tRNA hydrolase [Anaerolinea thermophila]
MFQRLFHHSQTDEPLKPFLIVGLGNPGREYRENRHNAGFMFIDRLAKALLITPGRVQSKALIATGQYAGKRLILAKPQTYMNLSGQSVKGLAQFYKIPPEQILVAHDDLDLPLGTLRLRPGGGSAGQKGVSSIIQQLGTAQFCRLRIGIGRPPGQMDPAAYVLQDFSEKEKEILDEVLDRAVKAALRYVEAGIQTAMNEFNGSGKEGT